MNEILEIEGLIFEVRRSLRRRTLGLTVDRTGDLVAHAPATTNQEELSQWIKGKLLWVHKTLQRKGENSRLVDRLEVVSGECITYLGQNYRLKIVKDQDTPLYFDRDWFFLRIKDRRQAAHLFQKWYQMNGYHWLTERMPLWEPKAGISSKKIIVGNLGFRWGSCSKKGNLYFNWRLFRLPVHLVDYVIVHELIHLRERNHTPEFWSILGRILPDWRERKEELSHKRAEVLWCTKGN
jgi:predicted metal-dependent hydrolase